jgi:hypothetical protein
MDIELEDPAGAGARIGLDPHRPGESRQGELYPRRRPTCVSCGVPLIRGEYGRYVRCAARFRHRHAHQQAYVAPRGMAR